MSGAVASLLMGRPPVRCGLRRASPHRPAAGKDGRPTFPDILTGGGREGCSIVGVRGRNRPHRRPARRALGAPSAPAGPRGRVARDPHGPPLLLVARGVAGAARGHARLEHLAGVPRRGRDHAERGPRAAGLGARAPLRPRDPRGHISAAHEHPGGAARRPGALERAGAADAPGALPRQGGEAPQVGDDPARQRVGAPEPGAADRGGPHRRDGARRHRGPDRLGRQAHDPFHGTWDLISDSVP